MEIEDVNIKLFDWKSFLSIGTSFSSHRFDRKEKKEKRSNQKKRMFPMMTRKEKEVVQKEKKKSIHFQILFSLLFGNECAISSSFWTSFSLIHRFLTSFLSIFSFHSFVCRQIIEWKVNRKCKLRKDEGKHVDRSQGSNRQPSTNKRKKSFAITISFFFWVIACKTFFFLFILRLVVTFLGLRFLVYAVWKEETVASYGLSKAGLKARP